MADPLRALALAARDGETRAFSQLYERTRDQAWRVLYRVVGPSPDLEDLLQESYIQLLRALKSYRGESQVSTFLHRVCVNVGLMHLRSKRRRPEDATDEVPAARRRPPAQSARPRSSRPTPCAGRCWRSSARTKATVFVYHDLLA